MHGVDLTALFGNVPNADAGVYVIDRHVLDRFECLLVDGGVEFSEIDVHIVLSVRLSKSSLSFCLLLRRSDTAGEVLPRQP